MRSVVTRIPLHYFFVVNCYVVEADGTYVLIDTGLSRRRADLERGLEGAGCRPGSLRLIVLTHAHQPRDQRRRLLLHRRDGV
jgi:glyoxylase-like metal-dependent hydrolase (beta-lactamase superfamily II)